MVQVVALAVGVVRRVANRDDSALAGRAKSEDTSWMLVPLVKPVIAVDSLRLLLLLHVEGLLPPPPKSSRRSSRAM